MLNTTPSTNVQVVDQIISARWIAPVEPANVVLEKHAVVLHQGKIVALLPIDEALARYQASEHIALDDHVLIPGLVNTHTHAAMSLLRGLGDDLPLMDWLKKRIWPAEKQLVSPHFVADGTRLACAEMLRGGITTFADMYFFPRQAIEAAQEMGLRIACGLTVMDFATAWASDADDYLSKGLAIRDEFARTERVSFCLAPHAPYSVNDRALERIAMLAEQLDLPIHMHVHETVAEIEQCQRDYGMRPLARLHQLGLLSPRLMAVHAVHTSADELELLALNNCAIVHCPTSNMKLGSGITPLAEMQSLGMRIGLGTDGAASNNRLDILQEMQFAGLLAKAISHNAGICTAHQCLHMATLGGAMALGLDHQIGSITPGKAADLCAIDLGDDPMLQPCHDPVSQIMYVAGREQVSHVWVEGRLQLAAGQPLLYDKEQLLAVQRIWQTSLNSL